MQNSKSEIISSAAQSEFPNIRRFARCISQSQNRDKIKQALELLFEPCTNQSDQVLQKINIPLAEVLSGLDESAGD